MWKLAALCIFHVGEQRACCRNGDGEMPASETVEVLRLKLTLKIFTGTGLVKLPIRLRAYGGSPSAVR